jgi:hypothetical protein
VREERREEGMKMIISVGDTRLCVRFVLYKSKSGRMGESVGHTEASSTRTTLTWKE